MFSFPPSFSLYQFKVAGFVGISAYRHIGIRLKYNIMDTKLLDEIFAKYSHEGKLPAAKLESFLVEAMKALGMSPFSCDQVSIFLKEVDQNHDGQLTKDNLYQNINAVWRNCHPTSHEIGRRG